MTLKKIIAIADKAYPDGLVKRAARGEGVGDTLAEFIAVELTETFDAGDSDAGQLDTACAVMRSARRELTDVEEAFEAAAGEKRKTSGRQRKET